MPVLTHVTTSKISSVVPTTNVSSNVTFLVNIMVAACVVAHLLKDLQYSCSLPPVALLFDADPILYIWS